MMWLVLEHAILASPLAGTVTETHVGKTMPHTTLSKVPQEHISPHYGGDDATRYSQALLPSLGRAGAA